LFSTRAAALSASAIASEISVAVRGSIENSCSYIASRELLGPQRPQRVNEFDETARFNAREMASLPKNGLLLTNLRVVPVSGAYLKYAAYLGHGKVRAQRFSERSEMVLAMGAKTRNAWMRRAGSFANYGVSAIATDLANH
jgi:hypothetical protein